MSESVNCPFCGNVIPKDALKCEECGALFREPELSGLKFKELGPFIAIDILTLGFFSTIWFFINARAINNLVSNPKDCLKLNWLVTLLAVNGGFYLLCFYKHPLLLLILTTLQILLYVALTYRVLRIIQKYTFRTYGVEIEYNPFYTFFFNVFYLVHFVDTYNARVQGRHVFFDWKSPQAIMLLILLLITLFIMRFYYEVAQLLHLN